MFKSISAMLEQSREFDSEKTDYKPNYTPKFHPDGSLWMETQGTAKLRYGAYYLTDNATQQLCAKLGPGTFGKGNSKSLPREVVSNWLHDEDYAPHMAAILNAHIERLESRFVVRTYQDQARAVLSEQYAAIGNTTMLETTEKALELLSKRAGRDVSPNIWRSDITPDNLSLRLTIGTDVLPQGERTSYGFGLWIGNNETGRGGLEVLPLIKRTSCNNSIVIQSENPDAVLQTIHRGSVGLLADRVAVAIGNALKLGTIYLNKLLATREIEIPNIFETISQMASKEGWSEDFSNAIRRGTEGQYNVYGLINGLTFAAQTSENAEVTIAVEKKAGQLLEDFTRHLDVDR